MRLLLALIFITASPRPPSPAAPLLGLRGLDRLYFTHVGSADALTARAPVAALLPRTLRALRIEAPSADVDGEATTFQDFPLPLSDPQRHFQAHPNPDGKLLPNYWVESTRPGPDGGVVLRLRGSMFRPQGAWLATGKVVTLTATEGALRFAHMRNAFGFRHEYDRGQGSDPPTRASPAVGTRCRRSRTASAAPPDLPSRPGLPRNLPTRSAASNSRTEEPPPPSASIC